MLSGSVGIGILSSFTMTFLLERARGASVDFTVFLRAVSTGN